MLFVIIGHDAPGSQEKRPLYREEHLAKLSELEKQGKLFLAGPFTDVTGSLVIVDVESQEEAVQIAENDPYVIHGVFASFDIKPFKKVLPAS